MGFLTLCIVHGNSSDTIYPYVQVFNILLCIIEKIQKILSNLRKVERKDEVNDSKVNKFWSEGIGDTKQEFISPVS